MTNEQLLGELDTAREFARLKHYYAAFDCICTVLRALIIRTTPR